MGRKRRLGTEKDEQGAGDQARGEGLTWMKQNGVW